MEHHFGSSQAWYFSKQFKGNELKSCLWFLNHPQLADFDQKIVYQEDLKKQRILM